jgi:tagaturonate epimerase
MTIENVLNRRDLVLKLETARQKDASNEPVSVLFSNVDHPLQVYPHSVHRHPKGGVFLSGRFNDRDALFILGKEDLRVMKEIDGDIVIRHSDFSVMKCRWTRSAARKLRDDFPRYAPTARQDGRVSVAFGDVLGFAGKAQLRAFEGKASLAFSRQCIHQLEALDIHPEDAIDAVTRTIFQEGYKRGYAAEACHLDEPEHVRTMLDAGYTRFSLEPSTPSLFSLREKSKSELLESVLDVPWIELRDKFELMFHRYNGIRVDLGPVRFADDEEPQESVILMPGEADVLAAIGMLGEVIARIVAMERVLVEAGHRDDLILEISFARSEGALTPFELYFLVTELFRHDVRVDFVAPGELTPEHWAVARHTQLSGLSGPIHHIDAIPHETSGLRFHGVLQDISYVTAMQCIAESAPDLFREIWSHSRSLLEQVREESGLELPVHKIPPDKDVADGELKELLSVEDADLFLRHTMRGIFSKKDEHGRRYLRAEIMDFIRKHESEYTNALVEGYKRFIETDAAS